MTTKDVVAQVANQSNLQKKDVATLISALNNAISNALVEGKVVHVQDFGDIEVKTRSPRTAMHPKTGEKITTQEHKCIVFRQNVLLKKKMNE